MTRPLCQSIVIFLLTIFHSLASASLVGSTPAGFQVTPSGAANYTIPIQVPPSTAGMQPDLSLDYNSQGGNGSLGIGWSLGGLSSITRCAMTLAQDDLVDGVDFDGNDKFCLNGQRLIAISGAYGASGTEYRTELDTFSKIYSHGLAGDGPASFTVETKAGQIMHYGSSADSAIEAQGKAHVLVWMLHKVQDRSGNEYIASYTENNADGEYYINRIDYTGNPGQGLAPFNSVRFVYQPRPDVKTGYLAGSVYKNTQRLTTVQTYTGLTLVKEYRLAYENRGVAQQSFITGITECDSQNRCLPETTFQWTPPAVGWSRNTAYETFDEFFAIQGRDSGTRVVDLNGDGLADLITASSNSGYGPGAYRRVYLNSGNGFLRMTQFENFKGDFAINGRDGGLRAADLNGDGLTDLISVKWHSRPSPRPGRPNPPIQIVEVYINSGIGFNKSTQFGVGTPFLIDGKDGGARLADLNGDGRLDILGSIMSRTLPATYPKWHTSAVINTGSGISRVMAWRNTFDGGFSLEGADAGMRLADLNGDGLPDLIMYSVTWLGESQRVYLNTGSRFERAPKFETLTNVDFVRNGDGGMRLMDLNGDGLMDLLTAKLTKESNQRQTFFRAFLSTGDGFTRAPEYEFSPGGFFSAFGHDGGMRIVDLNGDGLPDLLRAANDTEAYGQNAIKLQAMSNTGSGFAKAAQYVNFDGYFSSRSPNESQPHDGGLRLADLNGDGLQDLIVAAKHSSDYGGVAHRRVYINTSTGRPVLETITNGYGHQISLTYGRLTDKNHYKRFTATPAYPKREVQSSMQVVTKVTQFGGAGGSVSKRYQYQGLQVDLRGRGGLGFSSIRETDIEKRFTTITEYEDDWPKIGLVKQVSTHFAGWGYSTTVNNLVSTTTNNYTAIKTDSPGGPRFRVQLADSQTTTHYRSTLPGAGGEVSIVDAGRKEVTTIYSHDEWGNATNSAATTKGHYGDAVGYGSTFTTTTQNTYGVSETDKRLGRLSRSTVVKSVDLMQGQAQTSAFEYNNAGLLIKETIEPDTSNSDLKLAIAYDYDGFGNQITKTSCGGILAHSCMPGLPSKNALVRTDSTAYDANGQFPVTATNALGHVETRVFEPRFGQITMVTGPNGLSTTFEYDSMGRRTKEVQAHGSISTSSYAWCSMVCTAVGAATPVYMVTQQNSGSAPVITYFDAAQRQIRQQMAGYDGVAIYTDTEYDSQSRIARASEPYVAGQPVGWNETTYDRLGRVMSISRDLGTSLGIAVTAFEYHGFKTVTIDVNGRLREENTNALGQAVSIIEDAGGLNIETQYEYDAQGRLIKTLVANDPNSAITMVYDLRGRKTSMHDPNMGHWRYLYNAYDELKTETNGANQIATMKRDKLGRMIERNEIEGQTQWVYDTALGKGIGKLHRVTSPGGITEEYQYDNYGRPSQKTQHLDNQSFTVSTTYDSTGRPSQIQYPGGFAVQRQYNSYGYLEKVQSSDALTTYWQAVDRNSRGQVERLYLHNGNTTIDRVFNNTTGWLEGVNASTVTDTVHWSANSYDKLGNLLSRQNQLTQTTEQFTYDSMNRLTGSTITGGGISLPAQSYTYTALGNIATKSGVGSYQYGSHISSGAGPHAVTQITNGGELLSFQYNGAGNMTLQKRNGSVIKSVQYTSFGKAREMSNSITGKTVNFLYGADRNRVLKVFGTQRTAYIGLNHTGASLYEKQSDSHTQKSVHRYSIYAESGQPVAQYVKTVNDQSGTPLSAGVEYFHRDHLGSVEVITDEAGQVLTRKSYDAWGQRRDGNWQVGAAWTSPASLIYTPDRFGFTGHEQIDEIGLVNMNGRVYDPIIGRFLGGDPLIQAAAMSQAYNRYSYAMNNPLSLVDPNGYSWLSKQWKRFKKNIKRAWNDVRTGVENVAKVTVVVASIVGAYWAAGLKGATAATHAWEQAYHAKKQGMSTSDALKYGISRGMAAYGALQTISGGYQNFTSGQTLGENFKNGFKWLGHQYANNKSREEVARLAEKNGMSLTEFNLVLMTVSVIAPNRLEFVDGKAEIHGWTYRGTLAIPLDVVDTLLGYQGLPTGTAWHYILNHQGTDIVSHSLGTLDATNLAGLGLTGHVQANALPIFNIAPGSVEVALNHGDFVNGFSLGVLFNPGAKQLFVAPTFSNGLGHSATDVYKMVWH